MRRERKRAVDVERVAVAVDGRESSESDVLAVVEAFGNAWTIRV